MKIQWDPFFEPCPDRAEAHFIEGVTIPPAVHVGLAEGESPAGQDATEKASIVNANIPGTLSSKADFCGCEKIFNGRLRQAGERRPPEHVFRSLLVT